MDIAGKRIWIIGASEGIGAALARALAHAGSTLVLSARNEKLLQEIAAAMPAAKPVVLPLDVRDAPSIEAAWTQLQGTDALPDIVVYNAGAYEPMKAQQFDLAKVEAMVDVNFGGTLRVLAPVLPAFLARGHGHIVLVGSVAGYRGLPGAMGYGASKAALIHLAESLRADLVGTGVGITIVNPGFVKTRLTDKNDFAMPAMITPEAAAASIVRGLARGAFEIHFPKRFSGFMKLLRYLPYALYFRVLRLLKF